ncbi:hypothetical protein MMC12_008266 [Toensbergia leucococca]|nr:hypothetical protein [Toensbergia leucococca]
MNNLASSYSDLGRRQEAVELEEKVLKVRKRILGEEHPDTLTSMNNLASSYSDLGRRQEAVKLQEKVVENYLSSLPALKKETNSSEDDGIQKAG